MKILFLAHLFPLPLDSGGKIKSYHVIRSLASEHEVRLIAFTRSRNEEVLVSEMQEICSSVSPIPLNRSKLANIRDFALSTASGRSFIISRDYRRQMQEAVESTICSFKPDVVHIDHLQMAQFVPKSGQYKTVLDHHNVESTIIQRIASTADSLPMRLYASLEWPKLRIYELSVCRQCDMVVTVSEEDKRTLQAMESRISRIEAVPIGVDTNFFASVSYNPGSRNILSIGTMYWPPNIDSMLYFCSDIYPIIKKQLPDCRLTIAGQRPAQSIIDLGSDPSINVTGYVDDIREVAKDCGVFVVPLRSGSGVRVKILNALAMGLPVVSTSIGAEGLEAEDGIHLLIADTPGEFARAVIDVLSDSDLAASIGKAGRHMVCERYSWQTTGKRMLDLYRNQLAVGD